MTHNLEDICPRVDLLGRIIIFTFCLVHIAQIGTVHTLNCLWGVSYSVGHHQLVTTPCKLPVTERQGSIAF